MNKHLPLAPLITLLIAGCSTSQNYNPSASLETTYDGALRGVEGDPSHFNQQRIYVSDLGARVDIYDEDGDPTSMTAAEFCTYLITRYSHRFQGTDDKNSAWFQRVKPSLHDGCQRRFHELDTNNDGRLDYRDDRDGNGRLNNSDRLNNE